MSPIGRIFIVLNLLLAAAFLGWASNALATTQDWKAEHDAKEEEMAEAAAASEAAISKLEMERDALTEGQRQFRDQRDALQAEVESLKTQLGAEKRRGDGLEADVTAIKSTLGDYNSTIAQLSGEKDRLQQRINELEREKDDAQDSAQAAEMARRDAEEALNAAEGQIADLTDERDMLAEKVSTLEGRLEALIKMTGVEASE